MGDHYCCKFCHQRYDECNCPSDMTPVRQSGKQYYEAIIGNKYSTPPKKLLTEGTVTVTEGGVVHSVLLKTPEFRKNQFDHHLPIDMKYLYLPAGTKLKVTIEVVSDENN